MKLIGALLTGASLLVAPHVSAQTDQERNAARSAAASGVEAFQAGDYDKAVELLSRAEEVVHAPTHLLLIARAEEKRGHLVEAQEAYLKIINERLAASAPEAFVQAQDEAKKELDALKPRVPKLNVSVEGTSTKDLTVLVNGQQLPNVALGVDTPMNPGELVLEIAAPGMKNEKRTVTLSESSREELVVKMVPGESQALLTTDDGTMHRPIPGGVHVGLAATGALAIGGTITGILALGKNKDFEDANDGSDPAGAEDLRGSANTLGLVTDILVGGAIVSAGVTTALYFMRPEKPVEQDTALQFNPSVGPRHVGLHLKGSF